MYIIDTEFFVFLNLALILFVSQEKESVQD